MRCALGIGQAELEAYVLLARREHATAQEMSVLLGRSRPTAQRLLQALVAKGLAAREQNLIGRGGYVYYYRVVTPENVRALIREAVERSYRRAIEYVEKLPDAAFPDLTRTAGEEP